ncbi:S8 family serine peptidase [Mangrovibacterium lignilyticum]|uniref:S8 family serine peptidase n=1 Tax=Mangrovibacterium lignilyticum TaxID=2668052 RepID=UPI0013D50FF1|nr:S8 family serine peptidase [Mangrovibacterium lignilyticum]
MRSTPNILILVCICFSSTLSWAQSSQNYYWVAFNDKSGTNYSIDRPGEFLSARAINRREKQGISIDQSDLPVSQVYIDSIRTFESQIIQQSKWLNGCTILAASDVAGQIEGLGFVTEVQLTKPAVLAKGMRQKWADEQFYSQIDTAFYAASVDQVSQLNGQYLHNQNYTGSGLQIAVFDAGFYKVDEFDAFAQLLTDGRLLGTRDFVSPVNDVFAEHTHGLSVLSTMGAYLPEQLIGTAPDASYYLFRTEDSSSEFLIEEDNWIAAAEYADSLGVDLINSSLGYYEFDDPAMNHSYADMDGASTRITLAAEMAVQKGMLVFASAGNEANDPWRYLIAPSDGDLVVGVGAVNKEGIWAPFSSLGPSADGKVKPNVAAMGWGTALITSGGTVGFSSGTSFSSPVLCGMAACLWQSNPDAGAVQIKQAIERSSSQYANPDSLLGYGIPDFELADQYLKSILSESELDWKAYPNPFYQDLYLYKFGDIQSEWVEISVVNLNGMVVYKEKIAAAKQLFLSNLANLPRGLYLARIRSGSAQTTLKLVKVDR